MVAGANVHDTKLLEATLAAIVVERPQPNVLVRRSWIASARRPIRPDVGWWNEPCRGCPSAEDYLSVTTKRHPISWVFCNWPTGYCGTGEFGALLF